MERGQVILRSAGQCRETTAAELIAASDRAAAWGRAEDRAAIRAWAASDFFAPVSAALGAFLRDCPGQPGFALDWSSAIPIAAGYGSGAAAAAAAVLAVAGLAGRSLPLAELAALARVADVVAHGGLATGLDAAGSVYGGVVRFTVAGGGTAIAAVPPLALILADSGVRAETGRINAGVQERLDADARLAAVFPAIGRLVHAAETALLAADWPALGQCMLENQRLLTELGVSCPEIDALVAAALAAGAYGAKLSGSGGGGLVLALAPPGRQEGVADAMRQAGGAVQTAKAGAAGARREETR